MPTAILGREREAPNVSLSCDRNASNQIDNFRFRRVSIQGGIDVSVNAIYMVSDIPHVTDFRGVEKDSRGVEKVERHDFQKNMIEVTVTAILLEQFLSVFSPTAFASLNCLQAASTRSGVGVTSLEQSIFAMREILSRQPASSSSRKALLQGAQI